MLNYDLDVNFSRGGAVLLSGYCPALIFRKSSLRTAEGSEGTATGSRTTDDKPNGIPNLFGYS